MNITDNNTEIESQAHKMWAEGSCDNMPTEKEVIDFMATKGWAINNVDCWHDNM